MINFEDRLKKLKDRRQGTKELAVLMDGGLAATAALTMGIDPRTSEEYENLRESSGVKYAIGAMAPVDPKYTQTSIEEGERVATTLIDMLKTDGINTSSALQGSVALNIHIKGHSDVDMLLILDNKLLVETPHIDNTRYTDAADARPMVEIVSELRRESETKLTSRYHQANVDCGNNKSISIEGGSLKRKVDIVPSCWYHCHEYQKQQLDHLKGIMIYHKSNHELIGNYPFKHIWLVNNQDRIYSGNLKKVVRLLKNLTADMPENKKAIVKRLSSYDLAAIAYHMNDQLDVPAFMGLRLVDRIRSHLSTLCSKKGYRDSLDVPDGTRKIFDNDGKIDALTILHSEVNDLARSIFNELKPYSLSIYDPTVLTEKVV